jgi:hypothetical protein
MAMKTILTFLAPMAMCLVLAATDARGEAGPVPPIDAPEADPPPLPAAGGPATVAPTAEPPAAGPPSTPSAMPVRPAEPLPPPTKGREPPKGYESPMRVQCEEELRKDAGWYATLGKQVRAGVHAADAKMMTRNYKHVVMAYIAIWVITMGFVVFVWLRQSALRAEILRLQRDLERAAGDDKAKK